MSKEEHVRRIVEALSDGDPERVRGDAAYLERAFPGDFQALKLIAVLALRSHELDRAYELFTRASNAAPDPSSRALSLAGICETLLAGGEPAQAERFAQAALSAERGNHEYHRLVARCYLDQGRASQAVAFLEASLAALPRQAAEQIRIQAAGLLMQAGHGEEALAFLGDTAQPQAEGITLQLARAALLQVTGRADAAALCYRQVLQADPLYPCNYSLMQCLDPAAAAHEKARLAGLLGRLPPGAARQRIDVNFALAAACDAAGEFDTAFAYLETGNKLKRASLHYSEPDAVRRMESEVGFLSRETVARLMPTIGPSSPTPIFIVGMPRSGTSLVEQILGAHPEVSAGGELPYVETLWRSFESKWPRLGSPSDARDGEISSELASLAKRYLALVQERSKGRRYVTDKMPLNFRYLGFVRLLFPAAPIVHCERDPVDTCLSCYQQLFEDSNVPFTYSLRELAGFYNLYRRYMSHWGTLPLKMHDLRYEGLIENLEGETRALLDHCGLSFERACLDFQDVKRTVLTASAGQVRRKIYATSVGKSHRYEKHMAELTGLLSSAGQAGKIQSGGM